jgi:hypothetical protein
VIPNLLAVGTGSWNVYHDMIALLRRGHQHGV